MAEDTAKLLAARGKTHGEYRDHARATQGIMRVLMAEKNWATLPDIMKESLHMFAHKMGRVVTGDPFIEDHWFDIEGYSRLVRERLSAVKAEPDDVYTIFAKATGMSREAAKMELHKKAYEGQPVSSRAEATVTASPASEPFQQPPSVLGEAMRQGLAIPAPLVPRRDLVSEEKTVDGAIEMRMSLASDEVKRGRKLSDDGTKHHMNPAPYAVTREQFEMMGGPDKSAYKFASIGGILCDHHTVDTVMKFSPAIQMWYEPMQGPPGILADTWVINRAMMSPTDLEQCMCYQAELNNSEYERIPEGSWQRKLYGPVGEKMIMLPRYRELWAK